MTVSDRAEPDKWEDLSVRILAMDGVVAIHEQAKRRRGKLLGKIAYESKQICETPTEFESRIPTVLNSIDKLIDDGMPPSNAELRDHLLPILEEVDALDDLPDNVNSVLRETDRYLAANPSVDQVKETPLSDTVQRVANKLQGRSVLFIGGDRRTSRQLAIEKAFGLSELIWFPVKEHTSTSVFDPFIKRDDVAVVVLAIRWASHSYGTISDLCNQMDTPLVRLPAGYNPNQLAHQIFHQCGDRLEIA